MLNIKTDNQSYKYNIGIAHNDKPENIKQIISDYMYDPSCLGRQHMENVECKI